MVIIRIFLIVLFFIMLIHAPVYQGFRCAETNWKWHLARLPLWKAIRGYYNQNEVIEVMWAKVIYK